MILTKIEVFKKLLPKYSLDFLNQNNEVQMKICFKKQKEDFSTYLGSAIKELLN